jgi:hypothetical protein
VRSSMLLEHSANRFDTSPRNDRFWEANQSAPGHGQLSVSDMEVNHRARQPDKDIVPLSDSQGNSSLWTLNKTSNG